MTPNTRWLLVGIALCCLAVRSLLLNRNAQPKSHSIMDAVAFTVGFVLVVLSLPALVSGL